MLRKFLKTRTPALASPEIWRALRDLVLSVGHVRARGQTAIKPSHGLVSGRGARSSNTTGGGAATTESHTFTESAPEMGGPGCVAVTNRTWLKSFISHVRNKPDPPSCLTFSVTTHGDGEDNQIARREANPRRRSFWVSVNPALRNRKLIHRKQPQDNSGQLPWPRPPPQQRPPNDKRRMRRPACAQERGPATAGSSAGCHGDPARA